MGKDTKQEQQQLQTKTDAPSPTFTNHDQDLFGNDFVQQSLSSGTPPKASDMLAAAKYGAGAEIGIWDGYTDSKLTIKSLLMKAHSEAEASSIARTSAMLCAVVAHRGQFEVYHVDENSMWDLDQDSLSAYDREVRVDAAVAILVTQDGWAYRPEMTAASDGRYPVSPSTRTSTPDPFSAHLTMRGPDPVDGVAPISPFTALEDRKRVFQVALFDLAMATLDRSEEEALDIKNETEVAFPYPVRNTISSALDATAEMDGRLFELNEILERIDQPSSIHPEEARKELGARMQAHTSGGREKYVKERDELLKRRNEVFAVYPILRRIPLAEMPTFREADWDARASSLGRHADTVLQGIKATRENFRTGALDLWSFEPLIQTTLAGLGIAEDDPLASWVDSKKFALDLTNAVVRTGVAALSLGLGFAALVAWSVAPPLALSLTVLATSIAAADAAYQTDEYLIDYSASKSDIDPDEALVDPKRVLEGQMFVVVAWLAVGLSLLDCALAIHWMRSGRPLSVIARSLNTTEDELLGGLGAVSQTDDGKVFMMSSDEAYEWAQKSARSHIDTPDGRLRIVRPDPSITPEPGLPGTRGRYGYHISRVTPHQQLSIADVEAHLLANANRAAGVPYLHGAMLDAPTMLTRQVTQGTTQVSEPVIEVTMRLINEAGQSVSVPIRIASRSPAGMGTGFHGRMSGPIVMDYKAMAGPGQPFAVAIQINERLYATELASSLSHELDEIADAAFQSLDAVRARAAGQARVMQAGGTGAATGHDLATANEMARSLHVVDSLPMGAGRTAAAGRFAVKLREWGMTEGSTGLDARRALVRGQGVTDAELKPYVELATVDQQILDAAEHSLLSHATQGDGQAEFRQFILDLNRDLVTRGSRLRVEVEPTAYLNSQRRYPGFDPATGQEILRRGTKRLDAGVFTMGSQRLLIGYDITIDPFKNFTRREYIQAFGDIPIYDIRKTSPSEVRTY